VLEERLEFRNNGNHQYELNVLSLATGMYSCELLVGEVKHCCRMIVFG